MTRMKSSPIMTYLILLLTVGVYLYMLFRYGTTESSNALVEMGAKFNYAMIVKGEWWRVLTPAFLHIGFTHILLNGITIYFMGLELEPLIGHVKFLLIYLVSAVGGNLLSFAFSPESISAGASTSIFGLFTTFIALSYLFPHSAALRQRSRNFFILIILNFANGLFIGGIDNFGHLGGAIFGFLMTVVLFSPTLKHGKIRSFGGILALAGLTVLLLYLGIENFNHVLGG